MRIMTERYFYDSDRCGDVAVILQPARRRAASKCAPICAALTRSFRTRWQKDRHHVARRQALCGLVQMSPHFNGIAGAYFGLVLSFFRPME
jgi:hypothetical protein